MQADELVDADPPHRQMRTWGAPGYSITFHTSALPMAGTSSQVRARQGLGLKTYECVGRPRVQRHLPHARLAHGGHQQPGGGSPGFRA